MKKSWLFIGMGFSIIGGALVFFWNLFDPPVSRFIVGYYSLMAIMLSLFISIEEKE